MNQIKLVLVDDDDSIRFNLKLFFEDEGISCDAFDSGEEAIRELSQGKYNAAIVDLRLPGMNGEEFILASKKIDPDIKFLIHTGSANYIVSDEITKLGIKQPDVLIKPVENMEIFIDKLKLLLNG